MLIQTAEPSVEPVSLAEARMHLRIDADITDEDTLISTLIAAARRHGEALTGRSFVAQGWRLVLDSFPGPSLMGVPYGVPYSIPGHAVILERGTVLSVDSISYLSAGAWTTMPAANYVAELSGCPGRITPVFGQIWPVISTPQIGNVKIDYTAGYASAIAADPVGDTITPNRWPALAVNDPVILSNSGGALPTPLVAGTKYYVQSVPSAGVYKLSATVGGAAIDLTDTGTATSFIGVIPQGIKQWILMRVNTLFEMRESVAILNRGKVELLPFVDGLLDPYSVVLA